jgi:hypothetical protein
MISVPPAIGVLVPEAGAEPEALPPAKTPETAQAKSMAESKRVKFFFIQILLKKYAVRDGPKTV